MASTGALMSFEVNPTVQMEMETMGYSRAKLLTYLKQWQAFSRYCQYLLVSA